MKNNFTQALKELTGFDGEPNQDNKADNRSASVEMPSIDFEPTVVEDIVTYKEFADSQSENATRITNSMVIKGNIKSKDNIFVHGEVVGNIHTSASINLTNLVLGDVVAQDVFMDNARLKGNVQLGGDLMVGAGSVVVGDIKCDNITIAGKIKGNCDIANSARMAKGSYLAGDIATDDIATEQGAKINGRIQLRTMDTDIDDDFDFGGEF